MCDEKTIVTLIELAKASEKDNPQGAAKNYLLAAEKLLAQSKDDPGREDEYISLANRMYAKAKALRQVTVSGDAAEAEKAFKPANIIANSSNKITFADIGGLEDLKEEIRFKIIEPFKNPDVFEYYGKSVGGGILMYGPPGCGKSLIAKATANEAEATFMHVKSSDLKSKYVGETEKNIAELFRKAREHQPTIIFFDEFEALGADRTESQSHERSAVAQLLTEMDGMDSKDQQILLLAATNEPWSIDPALRREGRFGTTIFIPPPDYEARRQVFSLLMAKRPTDKLDFDELAVLSAGLSGADIKAVCEQATDIPLKETIHTGKRRRICMADMKTAIESCQSVMKQWFEKARQQVIRKNLAESFIDLVEPRA